MDYQLTCVAPTTVPANTGPFVDACTGAGGSVAWVEPASAIPELTLEGAGIIASAVLLLWATAYAFRVLGRQIRED